MKAPMSLVLFTISLLSEQTREIGNKLLRCSKHPTRSVEMQGRSLFVERTGKRLDLIKTSLLKRAKQLLPNNMYLPNLCVP